MIEKPESRFNHLVDQVFDAWNRDPLTFMIGASILMGGAAKLINSISGISSRRAYARLHGK